MEQSYNHILHMEADQVVLFADILGFANLINSNIKTTAQTNGINIDVQKAYQSVTEKYSSEYQKRRGIKFLWVSDSIFITCKIRDVNNLLEELNYITNQLLCVHFVLRGALSVGYLYFEKNLWGTAVTEAVNLEKTIARYPRIIISAANFTKLPISDCKKNFFKKTERPDYLYYDFFDSFFSDHIQLNDPLGCYINVYSKQIESQFVCSKKYEHKRKWAFLALQLSKAITFHGLYIDNEHQKALSQNDGSVKRHLSEVKCQEKMKRALAFAASFRGIKIRKALQ